MVQCQKYILMAYTDLHHSLNLSANCSIGCKIIKHRDKWRKYNRNEKVWKLCVTFTFSFKLMGHLWAQCLFHVQRTTTNVTFARPILIRDSLTFQNKRYTYKHFLCSASLFYCENFFWGGGTQQPQRARASSFTTFLDHTQRRTTVGRTPLDEWSARRRIFFLTTHNTHDRHPCPQWDSNPQSQQASSRRPTP
jgi:hypothetical protein